jgi:hypothetical protein
VARWFIPAIGFAAKAYIPVIEGMKDFKGVMHHTAVSQSPPLLFQLTISAFSRRCAD